MQICCRMRITNTSSRMQAASYDSVKFQVIRLMRMLVQICQTLDVVPSEVLNCMLDAF